MSFSVAGYSRGRIPGSTLRSTPWRGPWHYNPRAALKVPGWRCNSGVCAVTPAVAVGGQRLFFFFFFKCLTFGEKSKGTEPTGPQHSGVALTETRVRRIQFAAGLVRLPAVSKAVAGVRVVVGGGHGGGVGGLGLWFCWISKSEILQWHTLQPRLMLFSQWTLTSRGCF